MTQSKLSELDHQENEILVEDEQPTNDQEKVKQLKADYDSPWKDILEQFFEDFVLFFLYEIYHEIDWSRLPEFLDKELQQIVGDAKTGRRYADKLVKVWLKSGEPIHVLIHIEVQGAWEADFGQRMYIYNYRIFDKYKIRVVSVAILTDGNPNWKPTEYKDTFWGTEIKFTFLTKKLLDYKDKWDELIMNPNPFAVVVMANLKTMETTQDFDERFRWKIWMIRQLYKRGMKRADIVRLLRFVDWMMVLPDEMKEAYSLEYQAIEEEYKMTYVSTFEEAGFERGALMGLKQGREEGLEKGRQEGREKGRQEGREEEKLIGRRDTIIQLLQHRFDVDESFIHEVQTRLDNIHSKRELKHLINCALDIRFPEEFFKHLDDADE